MQYLANKKGVYIDNFLFHNKGLRYKLCGYSILCCTDEPASVFLVSPTGRVLYSPKPGEYKETGENSHEIDIDWR